MQWFAEILWYTGKQLKENGDKFPGETKSQAEAAIKEGQELLKKPEATAEEFQKAHEAIIKPLSEAAQAIYAEAAKQAEANPQAGADAKAGKTKDGKVVDGDFEVVDDGKK